MGLTGTTLVLVSLAFFGTAAAHNCKNGTRPTSEKNREGCDFYCWNTDTNSWDQFFFKDGETCFYNNGDRGSCQNGECHLNTNSGVPTDTDYTPVETEGPKQKKKKQKKAKILHSKSKKN
ncbi:secreted salivary gland protein 2 precursor, putative [Ixodes scapularis]|uniref:Secreted salivary gland protein 2, putative n=1 Tax=Ixodes scapularis TaxID=6945 RepID=B7QGC4_IXOSC|nr:secreted salivary gland protein 2 precursor, putative [Ixodes scapularis]|eukprot:XP_002401410.1 secreted salivary gland protein 2 precursor, putative [Ixodes scapularis]